MTVAAQALTPDDPDLSPWWLRTVAIVMVLGFAGLIAITSLAYRNAPPIPGKVVDAQGGVVFTSSGIGERQDVFLKYGLMANGSIWGHGAYLGRDYTASALHRFGEDTPAAIAEREYKQALVSLTPGQRAAVMAATAVELKTNRYDPARATPTPTTFRYDPSVGNVPTPDALLWSALSLIVLLVGVAVVLFHLRRFAAGDRHDEGLSWNAGSWREEEVCRALDDQSARQHHQER